MSTLILQWIGGITVFSATAYLLIKYFAQKIFENYLVKEVEAFRNNLRRATEKHLFIHQLQFKAEFDIYKSLWNLLAELKIKTEAISPLADFLDEGKNYEQTINRRLGELSEVGNSVIKEVYNNKPFYSDSVYMEINEMLKIVRMEMVHVSSLLEKNNKAFWRERPDRMNKLNDATEAICTAIRARIGSFEKVNFD